MKKIIYSILVVCYLVNFVSASNISEEEIARWKQVGVKYSIKDMKKIGLTPETYSGWIKIGVDTYDIYKWHNSGVKTFEEAAKWKSIGIHRSYVRNWIEAGITLEEANKWIRLMKVSPNGVGAMYWKKAGIQTPEEALKWKQAGIRLREVSMWERAGLTIEEIAKWKSIEITNVSFIAKMKEEGVSTEEVSEWIKVGINNYNKIIKMKKAGVFPQEVSEWKKAGVKVRDIERWKKEGLTAEEVMKWKEIRVPIYRISALKKEGLSPDEVVKWEKAGVTNQMIHTLKVDGLTVNEVIEWKEINVSPFDIVSMKKRGLLPGEIKKWAKAGVSRNDIIYIKEAGLSIEEAHKWKRAGISSKSMFEWKKEGVTLTDATNWIALEINPFRMRKFKKIGITSPEEAGKWRRARIFKLRNINFLKSINVNPDKITKKGIEKNHKIISFLASYFDKSLWKEVYGKISDKCQNNKCIVTSFTNTAKVRDDRLLVKIDGSSVLLEFPSQGFFSSSKVPDTFTLINNREKRFRSILKPSGTNEIELDGEEYKIETYEVIVAPIARK